MQTRLTINGTVYNSDKLISSSYQQVINSGEQFNVGCVASAQLVFKSREQFTVGDTVTFESRPKYADPSTGTFTNYGIFTIKDIQTAVQEKTGSKVYTYTCYDNVSKFDTVVDSWYAGINPTSSNPVNLQTMWQGLCTYLGLTGNNIGGMIDPASLTSKPFLATNLNGKTVIQWIAQVCGGYVCANVDGTVAIKRLPSSSSATLTYANYSKKTVANFTCAHIEQILVQKNAQGETRSFGSGSPLLKISGNPLLYEHQNSLDYIVNLLGTVMYSDYTPMTVQLYEDYGINAGDRITVDGVDTYVFSKKFDAKGVTLTSTGLKTRQEETAMQNQFVDTTTLTNNYYSKSDFNTSGITIDTTHYGFIVDDGSQRSQLTPVEFNHIGPGSNQVNVNGYGFKWFDNSGYLRYSLGDYSGYKALLGFDTSGNITSYLAPDAYDQWSRLMDGTTASWGINSTYTEFTPSNPTSDFKYAIKMYIVELTDISGGYVYGSTVVPAWKIGSEQIEQTSYTQTIGVYGYNWAQDVLAYGHCWIDFKNWKFKIRSNTAQTYVRVKCIF